MKLNISLSKDIKIKKNDNSKVASSDKKDKEPIDKKDMLWYAGSIFFLVLALLPVLFRNMDANYSPGNKRTNNTTTTPKVEAKKDKLICSRTLEEEGYSYRVEVTSVYTNNYVDNSIIRYQVTLDPAYNIIFDDVEIPEYLEISKIGQRGLNISVEGQTYIVKIDYSLNPGLRTNEILANHNKSLDEQRDNYQKNEYICIVE